VTEPWDFARAVEAGRTASARQRDAEQAVRDASEDLADKERLYRVALAQQIVQQHANGAAWTVAQDLARGHDPVAELRYHRDVAKGVLEAAEQSAWRHTADRKDVQEFLDWSKRASFLDTIPVDTPVIGRRAA